MNCTRGGRGGRRARARSKSCSRTQKHSFRSGYMSEPDSRGKAALSEINATLDSHVFKVGDAVWAKMKGYPLWPGKVIDIGPEQKNQKKYQIYFFGSCNHAWIKHSNVIPHTEEIISTLSKKRTALHQIAIDELIKYYIDYIEEGEESKSSESSDHENKIDTSDSDSDEREVPVPTFETFSESEVETDTNTSDFSCNSLENKPSTSTYKKSATNKRHPSASSQKPKHRKLIVLPIRSINEIHFNKESVDILEKFKNLKLGFIGVGNIGRFFIKRMLENGNSVSVWYEDFYDFVCTDLSQMGAKVVKNPEDLIMGCEITFCCVKDSVAVKEVLFSNHGVIKGLEKTNQSKDHNTPFRGYIEMSSVDSETSSTNAEAVIRNGGRYLEACNISKESDLGQFVYLVAGEFTLYKTVLPFLEVLSSKVVFTGIEPGKACGVKTVYNAVCGTICAAVAESMVLIHRLNLPKDEFIDLIRYGPLNSMPIVELAKRMSEENFKKDISLKSMEQDLFDAVKMGHKFMQSTPTISTASDLYKRAKTTEISADISAVYKLLKN